MPERKSIAVIGAGISGLGAAWLLARRHDVTIFEREARIGGHSNTVDVPGEAEGSDRSVPVDTGFIVYNEASYPNLVALFSHLNVPTAPTRMSFSVSLDGGAYEYSGTGLTGLFGQPANLLRPSHWRMTADILRFFRESRALLEAPTGDVGPSLGDYLAANGYGQAFVDRHILPMAAAIWSTPSAEVMRFPAASFVRFFDNHGLLQARNQPVWRTVVGGSRAYVRRLMDDMPAQVRPATPAIGVARGHDHVIVAHAGGRERFDDVVIATHANEALALLQDPDAEERRLLGAFRYAINHAVLHRDHGLMPRRRRLWSSWNYLGAGAGRNRALSLTYWMNNLQPLGAACAPTFVTLNPTRAIAPAKVVARMDYAHPMFDAAAMSAQRDLWRLQGRRRTWFCGSYFGYGFHEDGLQAGLAVAEAVGDVRRPWQVEAESGRIHPGPAAFRDAGLLEAAE